MGRKRIIEEVEGDSWDFFGLSYSSWLVLPRVALQSMPPKWQVKFFNMVSQIEETLEFPEECTGEYVVTMKKGNRFVKNPFPHYRHHELPKRKR